MSEKEPREKDESYRKDWLSDMKEINTFKLFIR